MPPMVDLAPPPLPLAHRSPGLTAIYNEVKGSRANHILDFGPSSAKSFNFFAQLSCKIRFENVNELFNTAKDGKSLDSADLLAQMDHYISISGADERFDVVLIWDIFNYLDHAGIKWLSQKLGQLCRPNALIHSVRYLGTNIPSRPQSFQIVNQYQTLICDPKSAEPRRYASPETARLLKLMPDFYLENTYLNFDGMVPGLMESVLRFQPHKTLSGRRQSSVELQGQELEPTQSALPRGLQPHQSPALARVFGALTEPPTLLDLGQKTRQNYDFLYTITQQIYAEDVYQELAIQEKMSGAASFKAHMLNFPPQLRFDIVLLWDILNFLSPALIEKLFERLRPWLHETTVIHAIVYSGKEIPATPQQFLMGTSAALSISPSDKKAVAEPLTSSRLLKLMKDFRLQETFMFQPGMQRGIYEYLFHSAH